MTRFILAITLTFILTSCVTAKKSGGLELHKYEYSKLTGWNNANINSGLKAFKNSCAVFSGGRIQSQKLFSNNRNIWAQKCDGAWKNRNAKQYFENNFTPYLVSYQGKPKGKFTGYFEKEIEASLKKDSVYKHPIYRAPGDPKLLNLTRKQIENGALRGKGLEVAYAKSAAKLYFLHIQGSGVLRLPDGRKMQIGYAAKNNAQYTSIGAYMMQQKLLKHGTADEISDWLEQHPVSARTIMNMNERYVFFALKNDGPYGSLGVVLTEQASLAIDPSYIPYGVPIWLQTTLPNKQYFTRLMNAQDTGSAIKGPIRGDVFFGAGDWASNTASGMHSDGNYFILLPREIDPKGYF